ncbi:MAG: hypothetical protein AAGD07_22480 [Planctomycetota bacterium]
MVRFLSLAVLPLVALGNLSSPWRGCPISCVDHAAAPHVHVGHSHHLHDDASTGDPHRHVDLDRHVSEASDESDFPRDHDSGVPTDHDRDAIYLGSDSWCLPTQCRSDLIAPPSFVYSLGASLSTSLVHTGPADGRTSGTISTGRERVLLHAALRL